MTTPESVSTFAELSLHRAILKAVDEAGYETPSPIQAQAIPPLLNGADILGQAQTGTGKTAAYALPLLSRLDLSINAPQILVLTPTRELAIQVAEAMQGYARHLNGFHITPIYGGQSIETQFRQLKRGAHVVVGSPGRLIDHLQRKTLNLDHLTAVVLDEADEMLRMGFIEDVEHILSKTPENRQVALLSATMPAAIKRIAQKYLKNPVEIKIKSKTATVSTINQRYWQVTHLHKIDALTRILEVEDFEAMIIFVRTKTMTVELVERLEARGYSTAALSGDIKQSLREKIVERLKKGSLDIVVATDVAARGLDVERISHVVNYDIPYDTETYIHRIGRTGRAGRTGEAILFISPREKRMLRSIEQATRQPIAPMQLPTHADIADRRIVQFKDKISETLAEQDLSFFTGLVNRYQQEHGVDAQEVAAALAFLVQLERPLLPPEPEEVKRPKSQKEGKEIPKRQKNKPVGNLKMEAYRLEVGSEIGVQPKNIVGAIANEAGLESTYIQEIQIYDHYSTVALPEGMPPELLKHLRKVRIFGEPLQLSRLEGVNRKGKSVSGKKRKKAAATAADLAPGAGKPKKKNRKESLVSS
ncbi:DEAD/DEAH box helicase [Lyngbya confervoides]|uniref:ATP-dependent RNA helicase DeaD n=1 Tax=Lyngbya confervoides BDU141951 TaxID=1574623 RepID=A0ABD4T8N7_9CYAN|nr:DEAD/DEAH box helicase [Lyngbya confervoides]MCM1984853.1 DEAD/DEAH box helicase [Lyngbya confervoides BDU141951]